MTLRNNFRLGLGICALAVVVAGCKPQAASTGFEVGGTIEGHANAKVYLDAVLPGGNRAVDSTTTDAKGAFVLHTPTAVEGIYSVRLPNRQSIVCYAAPDPVRVTANAGQFSRGKATGNKGTLVLAEFSQRRSRLRSQYVREMRGLNQLSKDSNPVKWAEQEMESDRKALAYREYVTRFADTVSFPELAHFAVYNLNTEGDFYYMQQYAETHTALQAQSPFLHAIDSSCRQYGDAFLRYELIDFKLPTLSGDSVALSSLRGKVVYFYVWASYCGLSRLENRRLAAWYDAHPNADVVIASFSIDSDEEAWRKAVAEDSLRWPVQWRGMYGWNSPQIRMVGVEHIPVSFVLDTRGIIRSKAMHPEELERDYAKLVQKWGAH